MPPHEPWSDPRTGRRLAHAAAMARLAAARVVLLGERHDRAEDHRWQAMVIAGLAALRGPPTVGLEMFPRRAQPALDAWVAGRSDREGFLADTRWRQVWGFDPALYMPIFDLCRDLGLPMLALNVDRPVVSLVGRDGWSALPEADRAWLSPARPASPDYRRYLFQATGGARPDRQAKSWDDPAFDRFVRAQQVWDRAFACGLARAAHAAAPVVGIIGRGHLEHGFGTPDQLDALGVAGVCVALPEDCPNQRQICAVPIADLLFHHRGVDRNRSRRDADGQGV